MLEFEGELIFARESALGTEQGEHGSFPLWLGRRRVLFGGDDSRAERVSRCRWANWSSTFTQYTQQSPARSTGQVPNNQEGIKNPAMIRQSPE